MKIREIFDIMNVKIEKRGTTMTIIEFYDKTSIENIAGTLLCAPENMVLIGGSEKQMEKSADLYRRILKKKGIATRIFCKSVNRNNLNEIVSTLADIVERYPGCVFDLTGGEDLYLVAIGQIMERYPGRVQCHRFNLKNNTVLDCDSDGTVCTTGKLALSVEENVDAYGGKIVKEGDGDFFTYDWQFNEAFSREINEMWDICRKNARLWNAQISTLDAMNRMYNPEQTLELTVSLGQAEKALRSRGSKFTYIEWILKALDKAGLIRLKGREDRVTLTFANERVKKCLTTAGQALELIIADRMLRLTDNQGERLYNDVKVGTVIHWNGNDNDGARTVNEIDVFAMHGAVPVFISCKNGYFDMNEMYKLSSVADRFGKQYAKKVLVTSEMEKMGSAAPYLRARAEDMGIRIIENVDEMTDAELDRTLRSLWSN